MGTLLRSEVKCGKVWWEVKRSHVPSPGLSTSYTNSEIHLRGYCEREDHPCTNLPAPGSLGKLPPVPCRPREKVSGTDLVLLSVGVCRTSSPFRKVGGLTLVWRWYVGSTLMETVLEHLDDDAGVHKVEAEMAQCLQLHTTLPL